MKRFLSILLVICSVATFGQPLSTNVIFSEDFNVYSGNLGNDLAPTITGTFLSTDAYRRVKFVQESVTGQGQEIFLWRINAKHPIGSIKTPAFTKDQLGWCMYANSNDNVGNYVTMGVSRILSKPIRTPKNFQGMSKVFLSFSHICKLQARDSCYIEIQFTNDTNAQYWETKRLTFTPAACHYFGSATTIGPLGVFSSASYATWQSGTDVNPTSAWWKDEMFDITQFIISNYQYMRIAFAEKYMGYPTPPGRGWFIDDVKVTYANAEIIPPTISYINPIIQGTQDNKIGPWTVSVTIRDRDTIDLANTFLNWSVRGVPQGTLPFTKTRDVRTGDLSPHQSCQAHTVDLSWVIPSLCYGDTVDYYITTQDVHGTSASISNRFIPRSTKPSITANDAEMVKFVNMPSCVKSHHDTVPVLVQFLNRSMNDMTHLKVGTTVVREHRGITSTTTLPDAEWFWTNGNVPFCMDKIDTILASNYIPVEPGWYTITVTVKERNHAPDDGILSNNTIITRFFACDSALNGTYSYGAETSNIRNMTELKDYLRCGGISGNVVLNMAAGNYNNITFQDTIYDGQDQYTVTFQSASGNPADVIISDKTTAATYGAITLQGVKGFIFNNLSIQGKTTGSNSFGVSFINSGTTTNEKGSANITVSNCIISVAVTSNKTSISYAGIIRSVALTNNKPADDNLSFINNQIDGGNYGIYYMGGNGTTQKNTITHIDGNTITTAYKGIYSKWNNVTNINANTFHQTNGVTQAFYGIHLENSQSVASISSNYFNGIQNPTAAICMQSTHGSSSLTTLISNNEILMNMTATNTHGIDLYGSNYIAIVNNSIRLTTTAQTTYENACLYIRNNTCNNIEIYNNMFSNECMSSVNKNYAIDFLILPNSLSCDYNNYYSSGSFIGFCQANRANIKEWQQAVGGGNELHSKSIQIPFENSSVNLKLSNYEGFECQKNTRVPKDILDSNRSILTFMGAYTTKVPPINMAIKSIISPSDLACWQATVPVKIALTNVGGDIYNFANNPLKVYVNIFNATDGITLKDSTTVSTGTLTPLNELQVTVTTLSLQANKAYHFTFSIYTPKDTIRTNDTLRTNYTFDQISLNASLNQNEFTEEFSHDLISPYWKIQQIQGAGNWTVEQGVGQQGTGTTQSIAPVYGTGRLFFNAKDFPTKPAPILAPISRITMPSISMVGAVNPILEIWYAHGTSGASATDRAKEGIAVKVSTNGGQTFTTLKPNGFIAPGDTLLQNFKNGYNTAAWVKYTYNLSAYDEQSCVLVAIDAYGVGGANINIDKITLRNVLDYDIKVNDVYYYSEFPTQHGIEKDKIKVNVSNLGAQNMSFGVKVEVKGANNFVYATAPNAYSLNTNTTQTIELNFPNATQITANGNNTLIISVLSSQDENPTNDTVCKQLKSSNNCVSYIDSSTHIIALGGAAGTQLVNKIPVAEELIMKAVYFMPVSALAPQYNNMDVIGKKVIAFASDAQGNIRVYSDTVTITTEMVGTLVEMPLKFYPLSNVTDAFYAGIRLLDAGNYIGGQVESPIREGVFYTLNGTTYTAQNTAKAMIGAVIDQSMTAEIELMQIVSPVTNCDLVHNDITMKITNNGSQTIAPGSIFHCWINRSIHFIDTLDVPLARQQVMNFTFSQHHNFANNQVGIDSTYNLFIYVEKLTTDREQNNDTLDYNFTSLGKSNVPIVTTPQNVNYYNSINLTATYPSSIPQQDGELSWWSNTGFEQWKLEHVGDTYTTPLIFFDTTFYVSVAPGHIFDTIIGNGTANGTHPFLFGSANPYSRGRAIYKESELKHIAPIEKIGLNVASVGGNTTGIPIKIYMKSTTLTALTASGNTQNTWYNWANEISDATLVYDGLLETPAVGWIELQLNQFYNYQGGNLMILTETHNSENQAANPQFKTSSNTNMAQACAYTTDTNTLWKMTNNANRLNIKFFFSALNCASEKVPIQIHVPNRPTYDVETMELLFPYTACNWENEHIVVRIKNMINNTIPANKVVVTAIFNGITIKDTIRETFAPFEDKNYTFTVPFDFTAAASNITFNYTISTTLIGETNIYTANDVITGSFVSNRTAWLPDTIHVTGEYTQPYTIHLHNWAMQNSSTYPLLGINTADYTHSFFYKDNAIATPITPGGGGTAGVASFTTPALFRDTVFYIEAKTEGTPTSTCKTKRTVFMIHITVPDHDLQTLALNSPTDFTCGLMNVNLNVKVKNIKSDPIPAGTFKIKANFTGTSARSVEHTINQVIAANATVDIPFTSTVNLGSATLNNMYNYVITVEPISPTMVVYRNNDTITGSLTVPANPTVPANINQAVTYGQKATVTPTANPLNYYYFYNSAGTELIGEGNTLTTPEIYTTPVIYKYNGRIEQNEFSSRKTIGAGTISSNAYPFNFAASTGSSIGIVLYTTAEMGGIPGRIDTLAIQIGQVAIGDVPIKLYLKNGGTAMTSAKKNWQTMVSQAQLIYDGKTNFSHENGWWKVAIPGGFDYSGDSLLLFTQHDCNGGVCSSIGVDPLPSFKSSTISGRLLTANEAPGNDKSMSAQGSRPNTQFYINYTCESPKGTITLTTTIPANDVAITAITNPTTPNNAYGQNEIVSCTITNYGTSVASNFPVYYKLENEMAVKATYTGSIPAGQSRSFNFTAFPINLEKIYFPTKFLVYTELTGDALRSNDTMTLMLQKGAPCISRATKETGADIANFTFAGIDNGIATPVFSNTLNAAIYTDYTQSVAPGTVIAGQSYQFSISNSFVSNSGTALYKYIFIDLNRDGVFDPVKERVFYTPTQVPAPTVSNPANAVTRGFITIPADAKLGLTRIRVITASGTNAAPSANHPCTTYETGETEDYAVIIDSARNVDLAVKNVLHPSGEICADPQGKIKINIANYGTETQTFSSANPLIITAIIQTSTNSSSYTATITEGTLASGETMIVKLDGVNYMNVGNLTIKAYLTYLNDQFGINDTLYQWANIPTINYLATPFLTDFEAMSPGTLVSPNWKATSTYSSSNFTWRVFQEKTGNSPNAGPIHDHTIGQPTLGRPEGKFAAISSTNSNIPDTAKAMLTSACVDLHYEYNYPKRVEFWKHIFSNAANASDKIKIQVGSGNYFVTIDSTMGPIQAAANAPWELHKVNFTNFDEVAQIRFLATETSGKIDPSLDDIKIHNGFPDVGVLDILYPIIYTDPNNCVLHNDDVNFTIRVKNFGLTPVYAFDLIGTASLGDSIYTKAEEHVEHPLLPGETFDYTFSQKFRTPYSWNHQQFQARIMIDIDENLSNNIKTLITCVDGYKIDTVGIEDFTQIEGVSLGQNIPNPATSQTLIPFILPDAGHATISIYSLQGQLIEQIGDNYDATYNSISLNTSNYSSGIYFYTLRYKGIVLTKKMVIQK